MKKIKLAAFLMLGALGLAGCQSETVNGISEVKEQKLSITAQSAMASADGSTRTILEGDKASGFHTLWEQTDKLGVYTYNPDAASSSLTRNAEFGITSITNGVATFEGSISYDTAARTYDLYAYYPRSASNNGAYNAVNVALAPTQTMPANGTHDPANDFMVSLPRQIEVAGGEVLNASIDDFEFRYMVGFMNLTIDEITNAAVSSTDIVESVTISARSSKNLTQLTGEEFRLNLTDGSWVCMSGWNHVKVNLPAGVTLGELDAWGLVSPFAAEELTFLIATETYTIEKKATAEQLRGDFTIEAGQIKTFNMDIDDDCTITQTGVAGNITFTRASLNRYYNARNITLRFRAVNGSGNGYEMNLDVYPGAMDMSSSVEYLDLPATTYYFENTAIANTVGLNQQYTNIINVVNGGYGNMHTLIGGTMTIEGDHTGYSMTFELILVGGDRISATYNGPLNIPNPNYVPPAQDIDLGTLDVFLHMGYQTDSFGDGTVDQWSVAMGNTGTFLEFGYYKGSGWVFESNIYAEAFSGAPLTGTYTINDTAEPGTALAGTDSFTGSWIINYNYSSIMEEWKLVSGTITSNFSDGVYTIDIDAVTSNGSAVTGTAIGYIEPEHATTAMSMPGRVR